MNTTKRSSWLTRSGTLRESELKVLLTGVVVAALIIILMAAIGLFLLRDSDWGRLLSTFIPLLLIALGLLVLLRRGQVNVVALLLTVGAWLVVTLGAWTGIGVRGTAYSAYVLLVMLAALLINRRAGYVVAIVSSAVGLFLVWANGAGLLINADKPLAEMAVWLNVSAYFFFAALFLGYTLRWVEQASTRLRQELAERERAEAEIRRLNAELEQRVAERTAQLTVSEERYRNFIELSVEGIWLLAFDAPIPLDLPPAEQVHRIRQQGYVAECNEALARMYGYASRREMLGKRLLDLYGGPASEQNAQATLLLVQSDYRSNNREMRDFNSLGEAVYFSSNATGVIKDNALIGLWGTQRDTTSLKRVEAQREQLIQELQAKNAELERFTYTVSHDLKAPLITIRGFLGFVEKDARAGNIERIRADMARIVEATDRMQRLLNELLELSRIGRMMNPPQAVAFEAIVREALDLVRGRLETRGVAVTVAADLPVVHGDRTRLVEVIQNLVDNAVKFMGDQAAPRIEIGARVSSTDAAAVFFVRDNGLGIEPQYHERVFGLFNKLDGQSEGTGVGLALVKRIVEVHGGRVWIESAGPGAGTTFCFTLAGPPSGRPIHHYDSSAQSQEFIKEPTHEG